MKSQEPRRIKIKNPLLRNFRNSLREIIKIAFITQFNNLISLRRLYNQKTQLTPTQKKRWGLLSKEFSILSNSFEKSICNCSSGGACLSGNKISQDRVWLPHYRGWFCEKCYEEYFKVKICENCRETDEKTAEIFECFFCDRYICEFCDNYCGGCDKLYCDRCYFEHLDHGICGFSETKISKLE